jgi:alkaline phosphatase
MDISISNEILKWGTLLGLGIGIGYFFTNQSAKQETDNNFEKVVLTPKESTGKETYVTAKGRPKNVIFMIGDGMGLSQITAGSIAKRDGLALEKFRHIGLIKTYSTKLITDSAAGATAMATGKKTYNGAIGMDINQKPLPTILELAELAKWATGILTTTHVTHATPACFYGHQPERRNVNEKLALDFLSTDIEVLMGGGWKYFQQRSDGRNLMEEAQNKGYFVVNDINKVGEYRPEKMICLIASELPEKAGARADFLPTATSKAIEVLDYPSGGFFLVIEGGQIDWGGHNKDSEYIIQEMLDFDKAIAKALAFAEKDGETLVVVTADHETGGYSINGGDLKTGEVTGLFTSDYHTATMVPVFAYGPGAESFAGVYDNTEIFYKFKFLMGLK